MEKSVSCPFFTGWRKFEKTLEYHFETKNGKNETKNSKWFKKKAKIRQNVQKVV